MSVMEYFVTLGVWNWFIAAAMFLLLEVLAPGSFMLWFGLSAGIVGLLSLLLPWPWQAQSAAFAVFSLASLVLYRRLTPSRDEPQAQPFLNRRTEGFVGRVFTLEKPIVNGGGAVRIGDTVWQVRGSDCPAGARVTVTRADGPTLFVERTAE